jgi:protein-disulfide isomerase-like protein with CxxC motif
MPFYEKLVATSGTTDPAFLAVFPDSDSAIRNMLPQSMSATVQILANANLSSIRVSGTPTLILIDSNGRVTGVWTGELPSSEKMVLIRMIQEPSR